MQIFSGKFYPYYYHLDFWLVYLEDSKNRKTKGDNLRSKAYSFLIWGGLKQRLAEIIHPS